MQESLVYMEQQRYNGQRRFANGKNYNEMKKRTNQHEKRYNQWVNVEDNQSMVIIHWKKLSNKINLNVF